MVNGDEIFTTLAILETEKIGGKWIWWFARFYFGAYIAIFTIVVINLLIAIYMSAYESIKVKLFLFLFYEYLDLFPLCFLEKI